VLGAFGIVPPRVTDKGGCVVGAIVGRQYCGRQCGQECMGELVGRWYERKEGIGRKGPKG